MTGSLTTNWLGKEEEQTGRTGRIRFLLTARDSSAKMRVSPRAAEEAVVAVGQPKQRTAIGKPSETTPGETIAQPPRWSLPACRNGPFSRCHRHLARGVRDWHTAVKWGSHPRLRPDRRRRMPPRLHRRRAVPVAEHARTFRRHQARPDRHDDRRRRAFRQATERRARKHPGRPQCRDAGVWQRRRGRQ